MKTLTVMMIAGFVFAGLADIHAQQPAGGLIGEVLRVANSHDLRYRPQNAAKLAVYFDLQQWNRSAAAAKMPQTPAVTTPAVRTDVESLTSSCQSNGCKYDQDPLHVRVTGITMKGDTAVVSVHIGHNYADAYGGWFISHKQFNWYFVPKQGQSWHFLREEFVGEKN